MEETQYDLIPVKGPEFPPRGLLRVKTSGREFYASSEAFGSNYLSKNVAEMQKQYSHPQTGEIITFREPTTPESILTASYDFGNMAKPKIFDPKWLQLGEIVRTSEGVFANVPRDEKGNKITDEEVLKSFLKTDKKVNGIWLLNNDFGFASYETFRQGIQDAGDFAESGLARVLEHAERTAEKLKEITSKKNYSIGVNICGFDSVKTSVLRVASLDSDRSLGGRLLSVYGGRSLDDYGFVFGVLDSGEASAKKFK